MDDPGFIHPDWVVTKPRLTGICGSESKQIFFDYASFTSKDRGSGRQPGQPDEELRLVPARDGTRGRRRRRRARTRGRGARGRRPRRAEPVAHLRAARHRADVPRVRGRRPEPVLVVRQGRPRARDPHRDVQGRARWLRRADARARLDAVQGAGRDLGRAGGVRGPVRGVAARHHPPPAPAGEQGARLRRGRARDVRGRDPARAVPGRRGDGGRALRRAAHARRVARGARRSPPSRARR